LTSSQANFRTPSSSCTATYSGICHSSEINRILDTKHLN